MMNISDKSPTKLNDDALVLVGLAKTLQRRLDDAIIEEGIEDATHLSYAFEALAQLVKTLADKIADHAT